MKGKRACAQGRGWPLERVLFAMAGTVTLASGLLPDVRFGHAVS